MKRGESILLKWQMFKDRYRDGMKYREIAAKHGRSRQTALNRVRQMERYFDKYETSGTVRHDLLRWG